MDYIIIRQLGCDFCDFWRLEASRSFISNSVASQVICQIGFDGPVSREMSEFLSFFLRSLSSYHAIASVSDNTAVSAYFEMDVALLDRFALSSSLQMMICERYLDGRDGE